MFLFIYINESFRNFIFRLITNFSLTNRRAVKLVTITLGYISYKVIE
jgi:hypothetical protein